MGFECGFVGLPNVGKSTLFNAVTRTAQAAVANYPFCTIEPNSAAVPVPDPRLDQLAQVAHSERVVPTQLGFADIAGLVRGASRGEGLGNRFLAHIREVDAVAHVLRCFQDPDVAHVDGQADPMADAETVNTELLLADLERVEKRLSSLERKVRGNDKEAIAEVELLQAAKAQLDAGQPARLADIGEDQRAAFQTLGLLTAKPTLYVANIGEADLPDGNAASRKAAELAESEGAGFAMVAAAIESELAQLADDERQAFLEDLGLSEPGLNRLVRIGYDLLHLVTFFTAGPKEARAWTVTQGATAVEAAARIHTDFARGFIRAETIHWQEFVDLGGETAAREAGRVRAEGRTYVVQDGDVMHFRFNV